MVRDEGFGIKLDRDQTRPIGDQGVAALAVPLRKLPALRHLGVSGCRIGDEGVASLLDNLNKDDFKTLTNIDLEYNELTDVGCASIAAALRVGALPAIESVFDADETDVLAESASEEACTAVDDALEVRIRDRLAKSFRFAVGSRVECYMSRGIWTRGTIVKVLYSQSSFPEGTGLTLPRGGVVVPYQVKLDKAGQRPRLIYAPVDTCVCIRAAPLPPKVG